MVQRISSPVFIGRADELRRVADLRARVLETGHGEAILVSGEAGIGKSRFSAEVARAAVREGWLVLSGACDEFGATARPFSALAEMVPALEDFLCAQMPGELERPAWRALGALGSGTAAPADSGSLIHLAQGLFRRASAVRPLLVIVDDLHWADESTRGLFGVLARGLSGSPSLLLGAYRGDEVDRRHPLRQVFAAVHRSGTPEVIELQALSPGEAIDLARAIASGRDPDDILSVCERSGGNAFFIEALLAAPEGRIPAGAYDVILSRLQTLGPNAVALAEMAALDTSFDPRVLLHAAMLEPDAFAAAFDALASSGLVVQQGESFAFRHALIREVIEASIPPARRSRMHARLAAAFEELLPKLAGTIARHWLESSDKEKALPAAIAAAEHAYAVGAVPESADWYDVALRLWHEVPNPEGLVGLSLARLALYAGDAAGMSRRWGRGIEIVRGLLTDPAKIGPAELPALWFQLSTHAFQDAGNEAVTLPLSSEAFRKGRESLDVEMPAERKIHLLSHFARVAIITHGLFQEAAEAVELAGALAEAEQLTGHPTLRAARMHLQASTGSPDIVDAFLKNPDLRLGVERSYGHDVDGLYLNLLGLHELNVERGVAGVADVVERGWLSAAFGTQSRVSSSLTALGRWSEALERWRSTKELMGPEALLEWSTLVVRGWGRVLARTGALEEARYFESDSTRWVVPYGMQPFLGPEAIMRVELARIARDPKAGRLAVTETLTLARGHNIADCAEAVAYAIGLDADSKSLNSPADEDVASEIDHWFEQLRSCLIDAPGRLRVYDLGMFLDQAEAERSRLLGDDRPETWEELAQRWHDLPRPYHEAYCRYRAASALLMAPAAATRKAARARAGEHLDAATAITAELGAVYLQADIDQLQQSASLRPRIAKPVSAAPVPTGNARPPLTSREVEVLRLLIAGESNGQIAIRLGITVKTASVHVTNILRKLGAANRVEAAVRASRLELAERRS